MSDSMPIELPVFAVIREGSSLKPSLRIVGRVNGQPINVPASDKAKAMIAFEKLIPAFVQSAGTVRDLKAVDDPPVSEPSLAEMFAAIQVLIANSEQVNTRLAAIEEHLAGVTPEPPAQPPADDDAEFWAQFLAATDPDPETFEPEVFDFYSRGRVLYQWRAEYTPAGKRIYPRVLVVRKMDYIRRMYQPDSAEAQPWIQAGVPFETAVYGILAGYCDGVFDTGLGARPMNDILPLAGKSAADLFAKDIAAAGQGGTPSGNEG